MASENGTLTSGEYIRHHLTNLTYGQNPDGSWSFAENAEFLGDSCRHHVLVIFSGCDFLLGVPPGSEKS